jgi:hypothetical protein
MADSSFTGRNRFFSDTFNNNKANPVFNYGYSPTLVYTPVGQVNPITGGWRTSNVDDNGSLLVNLSGTSVTATFTGGPVTIQNTAPIAVSGVFSASVGNIAVTGGSMSVTSTGVTVNGVVGLTGVGNVTGSVIANWPTSTTVSTSTPSTSNGQTLAQNLNRKSWFIQNVATGSAPLFVNFGATASTQAYSMVLKGSSALFAGDGGTFLDDGARWKGSVFVSGQFTNYIAWELT